MKIDCIEIEMPRYLFYGQSESTIKVSCLFCLVGIQTKMVSRICKAFSNSVHN